MKRNSKLRQQMSTKNGAGTDVFEVRRKGEGEIQPTRK